MSSLRKLDQRAFTLVEVLVIAPVVMLSVLIMLNFLFSQYGQLTQQGVQLDLQVEAQKTVFSMQDDVFFAAGFLSERSDNLVDSYEPSGGWQHTSTPETLIVAIPALTKNHRLSDRQPVYIDEVGCDASVIENNSILVNNIVYFASGTNFYKRTITAPASLSTCGTSYQSQNCPAEHVTSTCPEDILLSSRLESFEVTYFDSSNNETSDPTQARKIKVTVNLREKAFAEDVRASMSLTMKGLNI